MTTLPVDGEETRMSKRERSWRTSEEYTTFISQKKSNLHPDKCFHVFLLETLLPPQISPNLHFLEYVMQTIRVISMYVRLEDNYSQIIELRLGRKPLCA